MEEVTENESKAFLNSDDSSLSLSITPPILDEENSKNNNDNSDSISEHISAETNSIENDRSLQELEVNLNLIPQPISQESKPSLNSSEHSFSLDLKNNSAGNNVQSILDEILHNSQFKSGPNSIDNSQTESLDIFANLELDDKSLTLAYKPPKDASLNEKNLNFSLPLKSGNDVVKTIKEFEEIVAIKDTTIAALTSELDSYREMSNTNTMSMVSTTEYKQLQEEYQSKLLEYNNAIVIKNELIQKLSESLDQSVLERKLLIAQIESFKDEIDQLQSQLQETTQMVKDHSCDNSLSENKQDDIDGNQKVVAQLGVDFNSIDCFLDASERQDFSRYKEKVVKYVDLKIDAQKRETDDLKEKIEDYESEIKRLRDLLANIKCGSTEIMDLRNELEAKYSTEVEELRTYFEKKCSDLERNYSEEVFSQHSRKMSGSSCSENSDILFSSGPGPGGDMLPDVKPITKKDILRLKEELENILRTISNYNLADLNEDNLRLLKEELTKCQINHVIKYDLTNIKKDLQNKYHAELEIMNEENENKIDLMNVEFEKKLNDLRDKYEDELTKIKSQMQVYNYTSAQEVASSGEFEINEVVESYERRLQEQVTLAKIDIISALENQIQRLVANEADDEEWPSELLQLRDRFTDKYERDILQIREEHEIEIERLKEEHHKALNGALERARRRSLRDNDSLSKGELELLKERDSLKKQTVSLRHLLGELLKYFTQCEDELNNTLVDELLKQGFEKNVTQTEEELNDSSATISSRTDSSFIKRVHLTPNFGDLLNLLENPTGADESPDISIDLKNELGQCLEKLKQDANSILMLTSNFHKPASPIGTTEESLENKVSSLTRQLISETQIKNKLKDELDETTSILQSMEKEKEALEVQLDQIIAKHNVLELDLSNAKVKIAELIENGHKEIVSVGYGDSGQELNNETLLELQEKARNLLSKSRTSADPALLSLIEDLCQVCEKIKEDSKKERLDLLQQIEAADKKYKQTREFLDEQANERELERDEAQKKIEQLREQLREREKDRTNCQRYTSEGINMNCNNHCNSTKHNVEQLELQIQELSKNLCENSQKFKEIESERDEAVEKIKVLREIIRELENQVETNTHEIQTQVETIQHLKCIINDQNRSIEELKQNETTEGFSDIQELRRHIHDLEGELQQLKVNSELAGSEGAQKQLKKQLHEFEASLEKKTKDLEGLYFSTNSCSSPSEDMSVRDVVRSQTPQDDCEIPLQQLARLREKLIRHSRAEDAAIKKIRDLEMQVFNLKTEIEENQNEKDILKRQIQEHLVLISDLQIRLDEQRIRAEHNEKQINSSLEVKIYDLQNEIATLNELLQKKDKNIGHLNAIVEETKRHLKSQEEELLSNRDDEMLASMQREIERLRLENNQMKAKMSNEAQILPNLFENIISDKNTDIEKLQDKLEDTQRKLDDFTSLNLDLRELQTISSLKTSGSSLTEILSLIDVSGEPDQIRRHLESRDETLRPVFNREKNDTVFLNAEPEISAIEKIGRVKANFSTPLLKSNSTELYKSLDKKVHFEDEEVLELKLRIEEKDQIIKDCQERLQMLHDLEGRIGQLQETLDTTERALKTAQETFEKEQKENYEREQNLRLELAEKKMVLSEKEKELKVLQKDSELKDEMLLGMALEKRNLEQLVEQLRNEIPEDKQLLEEKTQKLLTMQEHLNTLEATIKDEQEKNVKLEKEITNNHTTINEYKQEYDNLTKKLTKKKQQIKELEDNIASLTQENKQYVDQILDKNCELEILREDVNKYQSELYQLEDQINKKTQENQQVQAQKLQKIIDEKDSIIANVMKKTEELNQEVLHLQDLVANKDKIIDKISDDHKKVNANLVTIQKKLKEPGGLMDTRLKLREEQKKNAQLLQELHLLKAQILTGKNDMITSVEEIANKVQKELDYSAEIDTNILSAVSDQSLNSLSDGQDKYKTKNLDLEKRLNDLQEKYEATKQEKLNIETQLDKLKYNLQQVQFEDAKLIEQMRIKLNTAMDNEDEFGKLIDEEKRIRKNLESELEALKAKQMNSKTESTDYKNLPNFEEKLRRELNTEKEKNSTLKTCLKIAERTKKEVDNNLKYTKQMLELEKERVKALELKVKCYLESEVELKNGARKSKAAMEEKLWEIETLKETITDLQKERETLLKEKADIMMSKLTSNSSFMNEPVHEIVMKKIQEINALLSDNRAMIDIVNKLRNEKNDLEHQLTELRDRNPDDGQNIDLVYRCDFLFAKNLRLNSFRKALAWQKRYLLDIVKVHELLYDIPVRQSRNNKFKGAAFAIVAICRMKFMVRRWNSGVRAASRINSRYNLLADSPVAQFQVGQPVSNLRFTAGNDVGTSRQRAEEPWSGATPPQKEKRLNKLGSHEDFLPLRAPQLLAQFVERIDTIQETLGVVLDSKND